MQSQKQQNDLCSFPRQTIQYYSNSSLCPNQEHWRSWSWTVLWRPTRSRTNTQKRCPFHHRGLECKSRKSRDALSNTQMWPWSTKWRRSKANRVVPRKHTGHRENLFQQHKHNSTQGHHLLSILKTDWLYSLQLKMENLYTVSKNKTWRWLWLRSWTTYTNSDLNWRK